MIPSSCYPPFPYLLTVILSEWSEWTPCSPCAPSSSLQHSNSQAGVISGSTMVSIQRRFRACLDLDSGLPVSGEEAESQCPGPLVEERLCPDANICRGNGVCSQRNPRESFFLSPSVFLCQAPVAPFTPKWGKVMNGTVSLHTACCSSLILCSHQKIVCRQRSQPVRARQAQHYREKKHLNAKIWVENNVCKCICTVAFNNKEIQSALHKT